MANSLHEIEKRLATVVERNTRGSHPMFPDGVKHPQQSQDFKVFYEAAKALLCLIRDVERQTIASPVTDWAKGYEARNQEIRARIVEIITSTN